jgi:predicted transcriptional regulator
MNMVIQVDDRIEQELRRLAGHQGRALADVVEAALRSYIDAEAITDVEPSDVAAAQMALLSELTDIAAPQPGEKEPGTDAQG